MFISATPIPLPPSVEDVKKCFQSILPDGTELPEKLPKTMQELKETIKEKFPEICTKIEKFFQLLVILERREMKSMRKFKLKP